MLNAKGNKGKMFVTEPFLLSKVCSCSWKKWWVIYFKNLFPTYTLNNIKENKNHQSGNLGNTESKIVVLAID